MNIAFVCDCDRSFPPQSYGGIELVIWNYRQILERKGHRIRIVNITQGASIVRRLKIIREVNSFKPDLVHIVASKYFGMGRYFKRRTLFLTDHSPQVCLAEYPYHRRALQKGAHIVCLSERISAHYLAAGAPPDFVHVIPNCLMTDQYRFTEKPKHKSRSIYLAAVTKRKRQHLYWGLPGLDFAGKVDEPTDVVEENYLGEWSRQQVQQELTEYANLVLLSESEAAAMVCVEALAGGLGLVLSEAAAVNLDTSLPFIDIVPEHKIHDREFVANAIAENRDQALAMRRQIRDYAKNNFDVKRIIENQYIPLLSSIVKL